MKTSVLLATYQGKEFLPELLDSLSCQSEKDFQVIFQDDGSTDGTNSLLSSYASGDARFIPGSEQGYHFGPIGNFLSLLRQTSADYVFLCDQDDIWEPEKIHHLTRAMQHAQNQWGQNIPLLIHTDCSLIGPDSQTLASSFFRLQGWDPDAVTLPPLLVQNNATGCTMLLNRPLTSLICQYGHAEKMFMHDWFIALTAASFGHIIFINQPLVRYRQHPDNAIGASHTSLVMRGVKALQTRQKAKERISLTYSHTRSFLEAYEKILPASAETVIRNYLATQSMPKWKRIHAIRRQGCVMQSPVTRLGQMIFG